MSRATGRRRTRSQRNPEAREPGPWPTRNLNMDLVTRRPDVVRATTTGMTPLSEKVARQLNNKQVRRGGHPARRGLLDGLPDHVRAVPRAAVRHALHAASLPLTATPRPEISTAWPSLEYGLAVGDYGPHVWRSGPRCSKPSASGANISTATTSRFRDPIDGQPVLWQHLPLLLSRPSPRWATSPTEKWFRYCYEVWRALPRSWAATTGWHDGSSYMQANLVTFIYVPFVLSRPDGHGFLRPAVVPQPAVVPRLSLPERLLRHGLRRRLREDDLSVAALHGFRRRAGPRTPESRGAVVCRPTDRQRPEEPPTVRRASRSTAS